MAKVPMWSAQETSGCDGRHATVAARGVDRKVRRPVLCFMLSAITLMTSSTADLRAEGRTARIVGLGAATCMQFNGDVLSNPTVRRDYLAWAQGFMSGIILSRPPGVDEGLDLNPATFDLVTQLRFLEDHCARNEALDFSEAVEALYKRLRLEGKT
ncbi:hypothetical protein BH10PSE11_BH10PSE11_13060 [soil metagenome]